jgi:hypothetical protein
VHVVRGVVVSGVGTYGGDTGGGARVRPRGERRGHAEGRSRPGYPRVGPEGRPGNDRRAEARVGEVVEVRGKTRDARGDEGGRQGGQARVRAGRRPGGWRRGERDGRVGSAQGSARRLGRRLRRTVPRHDGRCSARGTRHVRRTGRRATRALPLPPLDVATGHAVSATSPTSSRPRDASARYDARVRVPARARAPPRSPEKPPLTPVSCRFPMLSMRELCTSALRDAPRNSARTLLGVRPHRVSSRNPHRARSRRRVHVLRVKLQT